MLRHVVLFNWTDEATTEQQRAAADEAGKLPDLIGSIRGFQGGHDAGINPGNCDFALVADFDDADGYRAYRDHPAHRSLVEQYLNPIVAARFAVQYEI